jgi:RNA polymerase sigma-32 factor
MSKTTIPRTNDGLYLYIARIRKFPMLTPESEFQLAQAMITKKDDGAREQLINSHLRFVAKVARVHHKRYGLSLEELIAAGNIGCLRLLSALIL